jgi:hypothetical protein
MPRSQALHNKFSARSWIPLASVPVFLLGLYPYIRELMLKFVGPDILKTTNPVAMAFSIAAVTLSTASANTAQLTEIIKPNMAPLPVDSEPSLRVKYAKQGGRIIVAGTAAAFNGLLTSYQNKEFEFDLNLPALISSIGLLATVELVTSLLGSNPTELGKLWKALTQNGANDLTKMRINNPSSADESDTDSIDTQQEIEASFPRRSVTAGLTALYLPIAAYACYSLVNEFFRNIDPSTAGGYTLFILSILASIPATLFDLDRWSRLLQETTPFKPSTFSILMGLLIVLNAVSASTLDAVRGYEVHEVGESNDVFAYLSIAAILLAKLPANITLTQDFGNYISDAASNIKAACERPRDRREASYGAIA